MCSGHPCTDFPWGAGTGKVPILTASPHAQSFPPTYPVFLPAGWETENPSKGTMSHSPQEQGIAAEQHRLPLLHFPLHLLIPEADGFYIQPKSSLLLFLSSAGQRFMPSLPPSPALALQWKYSPRGPSTRTWRGCRLLSVTKLAQLFSKQKQRAEQPPAEELPCGDAQTQGLSAAGAHAAHHALRN